MRNSNNIRRKRPFTAFIYWFWRLFSSVRLAIVLIFIITGLSLLGALLIQVPPEIAGDPQVYSSWVDTVARNKVGIWTPFLSTLRLFDVFRSPWFIGTCTLLMLNIFICSVNRWSSISQSLRGGPVLLKENFYSSGKANTELKDIRANTSDIALVVEKTLKGQGYRTRKEVLKDNVYIAADKNRYFRLGTYFSHFSLILFVIAFIAGNFLGFRDVGFTVPAGGIREVGHETGLSLKLVSFTDEYYNSGKPSDYRSEVILYEDGKPVKQATIQVNHPLVYRGTRFYQSYFGPAATIQVRDEKERNVFIGNVVMDSSFTVEGYRRYEGIFDLPGDDLSIRIIGSAVNAEDLIIPEGTMAVDVRHGSEQIDFKLVEMGVPGFVGGLEVTFLEESNFSGFQVSQDPANILIWIASAFFIIGICSVLYFPYRQAWIILQQDCKGNSRLLIRTRAPKGFRSEAGLKSLVNKIDEELQGKSLKRKKGK